ncbi:MAG TPA: hypothetical protein VGI58_02115 [Streptosporangiaceae bacterium]
MPGRLVLRPAAVAQPGFGTPWDNDLAAAASSRRRLLSWAADDGVLVHAYHLPFPGLGQVARRADAFAWRAVSSP